VLFLSDPNFLMILLECPVTPIMIGG